MFGKRSYMCHSTAEALHSKYEYISDPFFLGSFPSEHQYVSHRSFEAGRRRHPDNTRLDTLTASQTAKDKTPLQQSPAFYYYVPHSWLSLQCHILIFSSQLEIHKGNLCTKRYNLGYMLDLFPRRGQSYQPLEIFFFQV